MVEYHGSFLFMAQTKMGDLWNGWRGRPYEGWVTVDPDMVWGSQTAGGKPFKALDDLSRFNLHDIFGGWYTEFSGRDAAVAGELSEQDIQNISGAAINNLTAQRDGKLLPQFEAGMRDINAVVSSAFVTGKANMDNEILRQAGQVEAELRSRNPQYKLEASRLRVQQAQGNKQSAARMAALDMERNRLIASLGVEIARIYTAARLDVDRAEATMGAKHAFFELEALQYGSNTLASISGGAAGRTPNLDEGGNALGGALSGAAAGAMIGAEVGGGNPYAVGAGAVIGGIAGFLGSR
jgi:cytochrome c553